ncbi:TetR/AcrR family transcriptional regulator [Mycobacterium sp. CVI_P3]|uniref:TetR/AcrR family transcriptional regulator n=1 Tax=Mycobacterium pinniadriaticum TaxID=2994102 RepID=A0ABT3S7P9_9MYCO|nr:TetR/AcrR family transcriptional regulator [Mycobacterium pinniadriaticum]MCX2929082.1 TetR/AcrR family transcriptional regulator [Mycobacterium pinniadriaticum]MCX2935507.1 TetR/AcrR family transcriptional regulator [Mycobacterium pinniadriaticum]
MTTTAAPEVTPAGRNDDFRQRLLDGLATSIDERGYRDTTVADIVRYARTSKRTFYSQFATKEDCFAELLTANNDQLVATIRDAVDPRAPWPDQVRQAVVAYVYTIEERPAITLSWIRELPALGEYARPTLRKGFSRLATMIVDLSANEGFRAAGLAPISHAAAVILVGGLRELTAQTVEDGDPVTDIIEPALAVSLALLGPKTTT